MTNRPLVEVTGNAKRWSPSWWCTSFTLRLLGAIPVRITVKQGLGSESLDAIIIRGGNDIGPEQYGGELAARVKLDPDRDQLEINRIKQALDDDIPLLGICRGAQLINVVMGRSLHRAIRSRRVHTRNRPSLLPTKRVPLDSTSVLARIFGRTRVKVNSLHHQAIREPDNGLRVVGRDRDDIVQAIESDAGISIIGVQWHPEYLFYLPTQLALLRSLFSRADR
jgi:putative glutamine amidotransferase